MPTLENVERMDSELLERLYRGCRLDGGVSSICVGFRELLVYALPVYTQISYAKKSPGSREPLGFDFLAQLASTLIPILPFYIVRWHARFTKRLPSGFVVLRAESERSIMKACKPTLRLLAAPSVESTHIGDTELHGSILLSLFTGKPVLECSTAAASIGYRVSVIHAGRHDVAVLSLVPFLSIASDGELRLFVLDPLENNKIEVKELPWRQVTAEAGTVPLPTQLELHAQRWYRLAPRYTVGLTLLAFYVFEKRFTMTPVVYAEYSKVQSLAWALTAILFALHVLRASLETLAYTLYTMEVFGELADKLWKLAYTSRDLKEFCGKLLDALELDKKMEVRIDAVHRSFETVASKLGVLEHLGEDRASVEAGVNEATRVLECRKVEGAYLCPLPEAILLRRLCRAAVDADMRPTRAAQLLSYNIKLAEHFLASRIGAASRA